MAKYYIASCVFTAKFPELSFRIQKFVKDRYGLTVIRCVGILPGSWHQWICKPELYWINKIDTAKQQKPADAGFSVIYRMKALLLPTYLQDKGGKVLQLV